MRCKMTGRNLLEYMKRNSDDSFISEITSDDLKDCDLAIIIFKDNSSVLALLNQAEATEYDDYDVFESNFDEDCLINDKYINITALGTMENVQMTPDENQKWYGSITPKVFVPLSKNFVANIAVNYDNKIYSCPYLILDEDIKLVKLVH